MDIKQLLKEQKLKATPQREAIIQVLQNTNTSQSAQEIFAHVIEIIPGINFSTIYRNLDTMLKKNILCRITAETGGVLYGLRRREGHHHHVVCKKCGATLPLDYCPMENVKKELHKKGFTATEHKLVIYGYCDQCNKGGL